MIDTDKYEGHTEGPWKHVYQPWGGVDYIMSPHEGCVAKIDNGDKSSVENRADAQLIADAPLLLAEVKRLRNDIRNILSDYDITDLIREVDEEDWNFEQQALVRMKELIE